MIETDSYGSEAVVARQTPDHISYLGYAVRMIGVQLD
jgi:hypothetical protein